MQRSSVGPPLGQCLSAYTRHSCAYNNWASKGSTQEALLALSITSRSPGKTRGDLPMTREHFSKTKLLTWLPSAVAGLAAFGAMTLVRREWAAEVGLLVYFPALVLMTDGIDSERLKRFFEGWRRWRA